MLSNRISRLDELHGVLPLQAIEVLRDVLGQPNGRLRHEGPVILAAPRNGDYGDNELPADSDFLFYGRPKGVIKFAEAVAASEVRENDRTSTSATWVKAKERDNQYGEYARAAQVVGDCPKWFCADTTGETFDLLLDTDGDSDVKAAIGDIIPYSYARDDLSGQSTRVALACGFNSTRAKQRLAQAIEGWEWVPGFAGMVGQVRAVEVGDVFGNSAKKKRRTYYLRATPAQDPNVQPGQIFSWAEDEAGNRIATGDGYLDAKIGTIRSRKPGTDIPGGWTIYGDIAGRVPVGWWPYHPEFSSAGATGGRHPIRPAQHDESEPPYASAVYKHDYTGDWYRTAWMLEDHPEQLTTWATIEVFIAPTALYADTGHAQLECEEVTFQTLSEQLGITIPPHVDPASGGLGLPYVPPVITEWVDAVGGFWGPGFGFGNTEYTGSPPHRHQISVDRAEADFRHFPTVQGHSHSLPAHGHEVTDEGHGHSITPKDHTHLASASMHAHMTKKLPHEGSLHHKTEDFRPPWLCLAYEVRVGPEAD